MRSGIDPIEFFLKCKKKPAQQELLDRVSTLSDEDIEKSGQPLWVRKALYGLRDTNGVSPRAANQQEAERLADLMEQASANKIIPTFPVFRWTSEEFWLKPINSRLELLVETNSLMLVDSAANQIKIDYSALVLSSVRIREIMNKAEFVGMMSDQSYIEFCSKNKQRT